MSRIPDNEINRIKTEVSIQRLAESRGVKLKPHGKDLIGLCPFHDDNDPSLVITPSKNLWNCLGACRCGGSVIDWVMKAQSINFKQAVEQLKNDTPDNLNVPPVKRQPPENPLLSLAANPEHQTALAQVIDYYHDILKQTPEALAYLQSRGLNHPELIKQFKLGFSNRTLSNQLPQKSGKAGMAVRQQLQSIGLLRKSGHEHFNGSLVVPVLDEKGLITEVYGRKVTRNLRKGTPLHTYLPGPHKGVFNVQALQCSTEIILCESLIDAMTFWVNGFKNVTTSYGINGFTADYLAAFKQYKTEKILIAYDNDEAGNKAAAELAEKLTGEGIECYRINFPKGMDANEYALQTTPASESLGVLIRKAEWSGLGSGRGEAPALAPELNLCRTPTPTESSPMPKPSNATIDAQITEKEINISLENRLYRIRGFNKNLSYEQLKINLRVSIEGLVYVDQLDLYNARQRQAFIKQTSTELGLEAEILKKDLGKILLKLEDLQEENIKKELGPVVKKGEALSNEAYQSALELLKDEKLLDRILEDFNACGVVGENTNKLVGYLACVSRKLDKPLAVMIQSSSAAGKSALMDAILNFIPEEERVQYSAMTGQSLYYMGDMDLKNKILAISEEEGAQNASYALKLLQSEGEVSIASTGKDETTGDMVTKTYIVKGPVMLFLTTTAINLDEELLNRCLVLSVDESREQTKAIHDIQRKQQMLEGLFADSNKMYLTALHRNAQRILQPVDVVNPYADQLTFLDDKTRTRRDHIKYLHLINSITFLHQYQRETRTAQRRGETYRFIEVAIKDIEVANDLANEILGQTLDELPPQTRKMLDYIYQMVKVACEKEGIERSQYRFTRKTVRHYVGWTDFQVKTHMKKLEEMEYVLVHKGSRGQSFIYEMLYNDEGKNNEKFLMGLIDVKDIKRNYDANKEHRKTNKEHVKANKEPSRSIQRAPKEHRSSIEKNSVNTTDTVLNKKTGEKDEKHISIGNIKVSSCRSDVSETEA